MLTCFRVCAASAAWAACVVTTESVASLARAGASSASTMALPSADRCDSSAAMADSSCCCSEDMQQRIPLQALGAAHVHGVAVV